MYHTRYIVTNIVYIEYNSLHGVTANRWSVAILYSLIAKPTVRYSDE